MASLRGVSAATMAAGGVGLGAYGAYEYNQGSVLDMSQAAGAGMGALGMGIGAAKIAMGGAKAGFDKRAFAEKAMIKASSAGSFRTKLGVGLLAGAAGMTGKAFYEGDQGDFGNAAKYGAGAMITGSLGMKSLSSAKFAKQKAAGIGRALDASDKFAARAGRLKSLGRFGAAGVGAGALMTAAGVQNRDPKNMAVGAGVMAVGGIAVSQGYGRAARNMTRSERSLDRAVDVARSTRPKGVGFGGRTKSISYGRRGGGAPVRSYSGITRGFKDVGPAPAAIAESVTKLRLGPRPPSAMSRFFGALGKAAKVMGPMG